MEFLANFITKVLNLFPPEIAHDIAVKCLGKNFLLNYISVDYSKITGIEILEQNISGLHFKHPIGLAAGFDKNADCIDALNKMGFSFIEVGTIVPNKQYGNLKPRIFKLRSYKTIINRCGFNSKGLEYVKKNIELFRLTSNKAILGISLGKNKTANSYIEDAILILKDVAQYANYIAINLSSPNTAGLRNLQAVDFLGEIIANIIDFLGENRPPIFVKLSPDLENLEQSKIIECLLQNMKHNFDGIILTNTSTDRRILPNNNNKSQYQMGGISGKLIRSKSLQAIKQAYEVTCGKLVIIGCGGIFTAEDVYETMVHGANLVQLYSAFIYYGPLIIKRILIDLIEILKRQNIDNISKIVGIAKYKSFLCPGGTVDSAALS